VLGFAGHSIPQLIASAEKLAEASLAALRANRKLDTSGTGRVKTPKRKTSPSRSAG
jgi:GntR family transcriptional regulator/MocR family aminotransferase